MENEQKVVSETVAKEMLRQNILYSAGYSFQQATGGTTVKAELEGINPFAEYELIKQKKSKLPLRKRKLVQLYIQKISRI